jgi:hypothetical protein
MGRCPLDYITFSALLGASLLAVPTAWTIDELKLFKDARVGFPIFFLCWGLAAAIPIFVLRKRYRNVDWVIYGKHCCTFTLLKGVAGCALP